MIEDCILHDVYSVYVSVVCEVGIFLTIVIESECICDRWETNK